MLAYTPRRTGRAGSPRTLMLVAAGHAVALALVLTARSDYGQREIFATPDVFFVPAPLSPPPKPAEPEVPHTPAPSTIDSPPVVLPTPVQLSEPVVAGPPITSFDPVIGTAVEPQPTMVPNTPKPLVRRAARFITPANDVRPPYPASKQRLGEEASLRLALGIDAHGRVISVAAVSTADPTFLEAARRHILRNWRYQPASEGGEAVASSIVVTLTFKIEE